MHQKYLKYCLIYNLVQFLFQLSALYGLINILFVKSLFLVTLSV